MFDEPLQEIKGLQAQFADAARKAIGGATKEFMAKHPEVARLRWLQYVPYFNDGDACEFSVHAPEVKLAVDDAPTEYPDEDEDEDDSYYGVWGLERRGDKALAADLKSLSELFQAAEGVMREIFGEHSRVTVGPDGEAKVEEYSHD